MVTCVAAIEPREVGGHGGLAAVGPPACLGLVGEELYRLAKCHQPADHDELRLFKISGVGGRIEPFPPFR